MGPQPTYLPGRHAPEIRRVRRRPLSNGWVTDGEQQVPGQGRPWPAPGPDGGWWHGERPARHRERRALPAAPPCAASPADRTAFIATGVTLLGTGPVKPGMKVPARMVSATGSAAYVGRAAPRWVPSLLAVLLCGLGIAWLTGGYRLPGRRR